jgi:hypothetical protein
MTTTGPQSTASSMSRDGGSMIAVFHGAQHQHYKPYGVVRQQLRWPLVYRCADADTTGSPRGSHYFSLLSKFAAVVINGTMLSAIILTTTEPLGPEPATGSFDAFRHCLLLCSHSWPNQLTNANSKGGESSSTNAECPSVAMPMVARRYPAAHVRWWNWLWN